MAHASVSDAAQSGPSRKRFAFTVNPLNFLIGRYGFNFEYQPVVHHGLIVSPHFDYLSGNPSDSCSDSVCNLTLQGGGAELGYRIYTGKQGFNGLFIGPSLLFATHRTTSTNVGAGPDWQETHRRYTSVGVALDVGGQWQAGNFVIGGGVGVQYKAFIGERFGVPERGAGFLMELNAGDEHLLRLLLSIGYAF